jgi:hypothetical protein
MRARRAGASGVSPGIWHAGGSGVHVELVSFTSGRRVRLESKILCKVLHLAMFHGWCPERLTAQPPSASWDTEIIVPYLQPYLFGTVSEEDASALAAGLKRMLASEALGLPPQVHFAAVAILAVTEKGSFGLVLETPAGDPASPSANASPDLQTTTAAAR